MTKSQRESHKSLMHILKKEVREMRDRFFARYLSMGLSQRDIAKLLGISRTSVQKRMRKS